MDNEGKILLASTLVGSTIGLIADKVFGVEEVGGDTSPELAGALIGLAIGINIIFMFCGEDDGTKKKD